MEIKVNKVSSKKVLVVDDEQGVRDLISYLLEPMGYVVSCAKDGVEGVEQVLKNDYDFVFLDVHMPKMRGTQALEEIKRIKPQQVVVIFSSSSDPFYVFENQAKEKGAFDCLYKPFELQDLITVMDKALRRSA